MSLQQLAKDTCIVRNTAARKGRTLSVEPGAASRYLYYGRILLDAGDAPIRFDTNQLETGLVCLKGSATVLCRQRLPRDQIHPFSRAMWYASARDPAPSFWVAAAR